MISPWTAPGTKIVFLGGASMASRTLLNKGNVYTVRQIVKHFCWDADAFGVRLVGIILPENHGFEQSFHIKLFRRLITLEDFAVVGNKKELELT